MEPGGAGSRQPEHRLLFAHGAVFHKVADFATDAAAAVIWSHLPLGENFRIEEILLQRKKTNHIAI